MTINESKIPVSNLFDVAAEWARRAVAIVAKLAIASLLVVAAGILAIMTAFAGLAIAGIALLMRFVGRKPRANANRPQEARKWSDADTVTLEARQTSHGWTVE